jgi:hypothetical protein
MSGGSFIAVKKDGFEANTNFNWRRAKVGREGATAKKATVQQFPVSI